MLTTKTILASALVVALSTSSVIAQSFQEVGPADRSADAMVQGQAEPAIADRWVSRTQLVWNEETDKLTRLTFELWQGRLEAGLSFRWIPKHIAGAQSGRVTGQGTVVWHKTGAATYDDDAVVATYVGQMEDGRRHGQGYYRHRSGFSYEGAWRSGQMHGTGYLTFTNGDHYVGGFAQGRLHGEGRLIDADGTVFQGRFVDGVAQGEGLITRADDLQYLAVWDRGAEVTGSREVLTEPRIVNAQLTDAFRVGVVLESQDGQPDFSYYNTGLQAQSYKARASGEVLSIFPASDRILDVWKGRAPITMNGGEIADRYSGGGFLGIKKENIKPVNLIFEFENRSRSDVRIVSTSLIVETSRTDAEPMLQAYSPMNNCGVGNRPGFDPNFLLENFGWSDVENGQVSVQFLDTDGRAVGRTDTIEVETFYDSAFVNLLPVIAGKGADVEAMARGYQCETPTRFDPDAREQARRACLQKAALDAGALAPTLELGYDSIFTTLAGTISYRWTDRSGVQSRESASFEIEVPVGSHTVALAECGEGGRPPDGAIKVFQLRLDQDNYRLRVPLKDVVPAGVTSRWRLAFEAERNSDHLFRLKFDLSDGQTVLSRPISLAYLHPRMPQ